LPARLAQTRDAPQRVRESSMIRAPSSERRPGRHGVRYLLLGSMTGARSILGEVAD
jgi:hypothetical protein